MTKYQIEAIQDLYSKINWMVVDLAKYYGDDIDEDSSLKVRPGYGYDKFYLDWVEGSYDMSLQSLINFMLQDHGYYRKLLSKETYKKVTRFNKKWPETLYDFSENEEEEQLINNIEGFVVLGVRNSLEKYGFSIKTFLDADYDLQSELPHISKYHLVGFVILESCSFLAELEEYLLNNKLSTDEISKLIKVVKESGENVEIAEIIYNEYPSLAKDILELAIPNCRKKSECTKLAFDIKRICNDCEQLLLEVNKLKETL